MKRNTKKEKDYLYKMFNLSGKVVVLTGGLGKLGSEYALALVEAGARVAILDVSDTPPAPLKRAARRFPLLFLKVDITNEGEVKKALKDIEAKWGTPTVLVNNAGWKASPHAKSRANPAHAGGASVAFKDYSMDVWRDVFEINTAAAAICAKVFGGGMIRKKKKGVIINIGSTYGLVAPDQRIYAHKKKDRKQFIKDASYGASKAALVALTRDLAVEWAKYGIRIVAFSPGGVESGKDPVFTKKYEERTPLGRMARKDEYNGALLFLASDASSYMTGTNLVIDGGWTIW